MHWHMLLNTCNVKDKLHVQYDAIPCKSTCMNCFKCIKKDGELKCRPKMQPNLDPSPKKLPRVMPALWTADWLTHRLVWVVWTVQRFLYVDWTCLCSSSSAETLCVPRGRNQPRVSWYLLATVRCCQGWSSPAAWHFLAITKQYSLLLLFTCGCQTRRDKTYWDALTWNHLTWYIRTDITCNTDFSTYPYPV